MKAKPHPKFKGIFLINGKLATINSIPGYRPFDEEIIKVSSKEYRIWDPYTSKPAAAIKRGLKLFPIKEGNKILYLGLAEAKTASFLSDIIRKNGLIFGVEISEHSIKKAIPVCERRGNIIPILSDARREELYENIVIERVDCLYVDVADPDQIKITIRNAKKFLKPKGYVMLAIKSQSINAVLPPKEVYEKCLKELEKHFEILDKVELDPYEKFHLFVVLKSKT